MWHFMIWLATARDKILHNLEYDVTLYDMSCYCSGQSTNIRQPMLKLSMASMNYFLKHNESCKGNDICHISLPFVGTSRFITLSYLTVILSFIVISHYHVSAYLNTIRWHISPSFIGMSHYILRLHTSLSFINISHYLSMAYLIIFCCHIISLFFCWHISLFSLAYLIVFSWHI